MYSVLHDSSSGPIKTLVEADKFELDQYDRMATFLSGEEMVAYFNHPLRITKEYRVGYEINKDSKPAE